MHGTIQARLAASAKLSLTVASKTVPPPIAALGSKVQRCLGKQGAGHLRFIICHCVFFIRPSLVKIYQKYLRILCDIVARALSMLEIDMLVVPI